MRPPFVRRYAVQIAAVVVAVVGVVVIGVLALRPSGGSGGSAGVRSPVTARATATPDPRVDEVKAVARKYIDALNESARTGDAAPLHQLTEPGSQADGNAGAAAADSVSQHHNFLGKEIQYLENSWQISMSESQATVTVEYRLRGYDAEWPSLRPLETEHLTNVIRDTFEMQLAGARWLIYRTD